MSLLFTLQEVTKGINFTKTALVDLHDNPESDGGAMPSLDLDLDVYQISEEHVLFWGEGKVH